jgi:hypothetical protein
MCDHGFIGACAECDGSGQVPEADTVILGPPPGSWADIARIMAEGDDSGFDWDAWKDEMKDQDLGGA